MSVDLKPLEAQPPGCIPLILDFLSPGAEGKVTDALGGQLADLVMRRVSRDAFSRQHARSPLTTISAAQ